MDMLRQFCLTFSTVLVLAACNSSDPTEPTDDNSAPVVINSIADNTYYVDELFEYDANLASDVFSDADGDQLSFSVDISPATSEILIIDGIVTGEVSEAKTFAVTVVATDPDGLSTSDTFDLIFELNFAPTLDNANSNQEYYVGNDFSYDLTLGGTAFTEGNGDTLSYEVVLVPASSEISILNGVLSGIVSEEQIYTASITATDETGLAAVDSIELSFITNEAPVLEVPNGDQTYYTGSTFSYDMTLDGTAFSEANNDSLSYDVTLTPASSEILIVNGMLSGSVSNEQVYTATITAIDETGLTATDSIELKFVENIAPILVNGNEDRTYYTGSNFTYDVTLGGTAFTEVNGAVLSYSVELLPVSSDITIINGLLSGSVSQPSVYTVTVTAADETALTATDTFELSFVANIPPMVTNNNSNQEYYVGNAFSYDATI
ncbi:putative Ig domain-containing protein, partial [Paraglaciecola marina]|uniref:putative Ig domain-containing protein n=1 Tax=Paraglaciecola marina TaxID=2500157 RepID=UPI00105C18AE